MRSSLEERIMSLQRFKVDVANAVVNQASISKERDMCSSATLPAYGEDWAYTALWAQ